MSKVFQYEEALGAIHGRIEAAVLRGIEDIEDRLEKALRAENQKFFPKLGKLIVGSKGLARWTPLVQVYERSARTHNNDGRKRNEITETSSYYDKKLKKGLHDKFYLFTGRLGRELSKRKPLKKRMGNPSIQYIPPRRAQPARPADPSVEEEVRNGVRRARIKAGFAGAGRYASTSLLGAPARAGGKIGQLHIKPFENVDPSTSLYEQLLSPNQGYKLANYQGGEDRQILPQYYRWWAQVRTRNVIKRVISS